MIINEEDVNQWQTSQQKSSLNRDPQSVQHEEEHKQEEEKIKVQEV